MAAKTKTMSTVKQILRLYHHGKKIKFIARNCSVSKNTIKRYLHLQQSSGHGLEDLLALEDVVLEAIFSSQNRPPETDRYVHLMDLMPYFLRELQRPHVTRTVLWKEYLAKTPNGYGFTQFCLYLGNYQNNKSVSMVMQYSPGEVLFVDYAGKTMSYFDKATGEEIKCQIFIASLGFSQKTYIQAFLSQKVSNFIEALNKCVVYFGGVSKAIVPDNLKSAVIKSDRYEPTLNRVLEDWANHNNTTILPARAVKPKDKSLEGAVKTAYSRVYAPLRDKKFTSIYDLNQAITAENERHNQTKFQKKDYSRQQLFDSEEKQALQILPTAAFKIKKYRSVTVQKNCYVLLSCVNQK
jgi:transposase